MYLEKKIEHLNNQMQAKVDYEESHKTRLKHAREDAKKVVRQTLW